MQQGPALLSTVWAQTGTSGGGVLASAFPSPGVSGRVLIYFYSASDQGITLKLDLIHTLSSLRLRALISEQTKRKLSELEFQFALVFYLLEMPGAGSAESRELLPPQQQDHSALLYSSLQGPRQG